MVALFIYYSCHPILNGGERQFVAIVLTFCQLVLVLLSLV